jgi:hypothetical protein
LFIEGFEAFVIEVLVPFGELVEGEAVVFGERFEVGCG